MRVLIVDDEIMARDELKFLLERTAQIDVIEEAASVEDALHLMMEQKPDLLFLDIELSEESGFDFAERLKKMKNPPFIVFATAYDQYALRAFEIDVLDYLLKPFEEERVLQTILKYQKQLVIQPLPDVSAREATVPKEKLALNVEECIVLINMEDIVFASALDGKVVVQTNQETYETHDTLILIEKKLPSSIFMRVHRSYIVNLHLITEVRPWFNGTYNLMMSNGMKIPASRTYAKTLKKRFHF